LRCCARPAPPARGQAIIEGVAWDIPYKKLARELHLTTKTVEWRLKRMREVFAAELEELGMCSGGSSEPETAS